MEFVEMESQKEQKLVMTGIHLMDKDVMKIVKEFELVLNVIKEDHSYANLYAGMD